MGSQLCQISNKPFEMLQKISKLLPNWRIFAKSGHTVLHPIKNAHRSYSHFTQFADSLSLSLSLSFTLYKGPFLRVLAFAYSSMSQTSQGFVWKAAIKSGLCLVTDEHKINHMDLPLFVAHGDSQILFAN